MNLQRILCAIVAAAMTGLSSHALAAPTVIDAELPARDVAAPAHEFATLSQASQPGAVAVQWKTPVEPGPGDARRVPDAPLQAPNEVTLYGWITAVADIGGGVTRFLCVTPSGAFEVDAGSETIVRNKDGQLVGKSALRVGAYAEVQGVITADARLNAYAAAVAVPPPPPTAPSAPVAEIRGRVLVVLAGAAAGGADLVVVTRASGDVAVVVDDTTVIVTAQGQALAASDLPAGHVVTVRGRGSAEAGVQAQLVTVAPPSRPAVVSLEGVLRARAAASAGAEKWVVGTVLVDVSAGLAAATEATVGGRVRVVAERGPGGVLTAREVEVVSRMAETVRVRGRLQSRTSAQIVVDGVTMGVDTATQFTGDVRVGGTVEITALARADGTLLARVVTAVAAAARVDFEGPIEAIDLLSGVWTVGGHGVHVTLETRLTGLPPAPGLHAKVSGTARAAGVDAVHINVVADASAGVLAVEGVVKSVPQIPGSFEIEVVNRLDARVRVTVHVGAGVAIDQAQGALVVGATVEIRAHARADGSLDARFIRVRGS